MWEDIPIRLHLDNLQQLEECDSFFTQSFFFFVAILFLLYQKFLEE